MAAAGARASRAIFSRSRFVLGLCPRQHWERVLEQVRHVVEVGLDFVVGIRHAEAKRVAAGYTEAELVLARSVRMSSDTFAETNPCFRFD